MKSWTISGKNKLSALAFDCVVFSIGPVVSILHKSKHGKDATTEKGWVILRRINVPFVHIGILVSTDPYKTQITKKSQKSEKMSSFTRSSSVICKEVFDDGYEPSVDGKFLHFFSLYFSYQVELREIIWWKEINHRLAIPHLANSLLIFHKEKLLAIIL